MEDQETFNLLFKTLKQDMNTGFKIIASSISELKKDIDHHIEKSEGISSEVSELKIKVANLETNYAKLEQKNEKQHSEFYGNFKSIDRIVYKIIGGLALVGAVITILIKLIPGKAA